MPDISRNDVATLIQEAYAADLLTSATQGSTVLSAFSTVPMGTKITHLPVLATLPEAGWVGESATAPEGVKPQSKVTWQDRTLVAEEVAVIIPVHENMLDDATTNVIEEITKSAGQAIGKKLDQAVLFGVDKPASWVSPALHPAAVAASQAFGVTTGKANENDLVGASNKAAKAIAEAGWLPDTLLSSIALRYEVANLRDANGNPIFRDESFNGFTTHFNRNGAWNAAAANALLVDSSRIKIGVRQDIEVKFLTEATLGIDNPATAFSLAERDMVALRFKARYAYVLGTAATAAGTNMVPVAAVVPGSGS